MLISNLLKKIGRGSAVVGLTGALAFGAVQKIQANPFPQYGTSLFTVCSSVDKNGYYGTTSHFGPTDPMVFVFDYYGNKIGDMDTIEVIHTNDSNGYRDFKVAQTYQEKITFRGEIWSRRVLPSAIAIFNPGGFGFYTALFKANGKTVGEVNFQIDDVSPTAPLYFLPQFPRGNMHHKRFDHHNRDHYAPGERGRN